mmetsp:Transcript_58422/g.130215  ORF Transcript_58422/g.130215 Transcript_58422/m.130215 type:complete len:82 (-) Transcript_58422:50-295(-)
MQARSRDGSCAPSCAPLHIPIDPVALVWARGLPMMLGGSACVHVSVWRASAVSPRLVACGCAPIVWGAEHLVINIYGQFVS